MELRDVTDVGEEPLHQLSIASSKPAAASHQDFWTVVMCTKALGRGRRAEELINFLRAMTGTTVARPSPSQFGSGPAAMA